MHFIQEIRFLKAYYWAHLGKFAFTPEDRIEWTKRAAADFEVLGISSDIYCNQDPGSFYYAGFQADLCLPVRTQMQDRSTALPLLPNTITGTSNDNSDRTSTDSQ